MPRRLLSATAATLLLANAAFAVPPRFKGKTDPVTGARSFELWDGSTAAVGPDGLAYRMRQGTRGGSVFSAFMAPNLDDLSLVRALSLPRREIARDRVVPGTGPSTVWWSRRTRPSPTSTPRCWRRRHSSPAPT